MHMKQKSILFFDGECMLCNSFIQFCLRNDKGYFQYISLHAEAANKYVLPLQEYDSIFLMEHNQLAYRSKAVIGIIKHLDYPVRFLYFPIKLIPNYLRDIVYKWVANNRMNWFGKGTCTLLKEEDRKRVFL